MKRWVLYAIISMLFAGFTSVVAKQGLAGISAELGLTIRTLFVCSFVLLFALLAVKFEEIKTLQKVNFVWLGLSGITTAVSWIFYYKAIKIGNVSQVALIDKGSIIITLLLSFLILNETFTWKVGLGAGFILTGLLILTFK